MRGPPGNPGEQADPKGSAADWYDVFLLELERFVENLPAHVQTRFELDDGDFDLTVAAPTDRHRSLSIDGSRDEWSYTFGKLWTHWSAPTPRTANYVLAQCDAILAGGVREVRVRPTGLIYHLYLLRSRGLRECARDGQFSILNYLRLPVPKLRITRIPPLRETA